MRWTNYPNDRDRQAGKNAVQVSGQVWADAPGGGNQWCIPDGMREPVIVTTRANSHGGKLFSVGPVDAVRPPVVSRA
jgi:hypothetical protein